MKINKEELIIEMKKYVDYDMLKIRATNAFTGWNVEDPNVYFDKMHEVIDIAETVIDLIEKLSDDIESLSSRDKLEAAVEVIDDLVEFNFLLEWVDGVAIKMILSAVVEQKNKWFGKKWNDK